MLVWLVEVVYVLCLGFRHYVIRQRWWEIRKEASLSEAGRTEKSSRKSATERDQSSLRIRWYDVTSQCCFLKAGECVLFLISGRLGCKRHESGNCAFVRIRSHSENRFQEKGFDDRKKEESCVEACATSSEKQGRKRVGQSGERRSLIGWAQVQFEFN